MHRSLSSKSVHIVYHSTRQRIGFEIRMCREAPCAVCTLLEPIYGNEWLVSSTSRLYPKHMCSTYIGLSQRQIVIKAVTNKTTPNHSRRFIFIPCGPYSFTLMTLVAALNNRKCQFNLAAFVLTLTP
jgi:hypothetical protein